MSRGNKRGGGGGKGGGDDGNAGPEAFAGRGPELGPEDLASLADGEEVYAHGGKIYRSLEDMPPEGRALFESFDNGEGMVVKRFSGKEKGG